MQELKISMALSERNNNKMPGDSDSRTLNLKGADIWQCNSYCPDIVNMPTQLWRGSVFHNPRTGSVWSVYEKS